MSGAEGGKEFARVVDLLLFHDARRRGETMTLFSDAAGDFAALDSVGRSMKIGNTGYQYKFYPSPLSDQHRTAVSQALEAAVNQRDKSGINRWIVITPDDLVESARRKTGGDVTWFESLRTKLPDGFVVEHWGHKQLQALFAETPSVALFYYPQLVPNGESLRKTIAEIRTRYEAGLRATFGMLQFVGMSVYKPEATRGVSIDDIYIPLTLVPDGTNEEISEVARYNPLSLLAEGTHHVILGDPGSGKSTLLKFLALAGKSPQLQQKFGATSDPERLPILVTLRRYADELKSRPNLSIIDFIIESVQADFSLKDADARFFAAFLESGRAILCFDGLDELPSSRFKEIVRDRILALVSTHPGNTCVVTSRIVGYDNPFRFDSRDFAHHRVARLQLPEIEQFVHDWYAVRAQSPKEQEDSIRSLVDVIRHPEHDSIRALAGNPLLLTIIALVHRIDAVLPDERVVLYIKCTETLLNTWHNWKYREFDTTTRTKTERRNRLRIEAIAYWMQNRSVAEGKGERSIVPLREISQFLTDFIVGSERPVAEVEPSEQAERFLEFVRTRAGLLIEVGDEQYGFVHLTFQEYLAAAHIVTSSEKGGAEALWKAIANSTSSDRWQESIRLLVASLRSTDTRAFMVDAIIRQCEKDCKARRALLLLGCVIDAIDEAEERVADIIRLAARAVIESSDGVEIARLVNRLTSVVQRFPSAAASLDLAGVQLRSLLDGRRASAIHLLFAATNIPRGELVLEKVVLPRRERAWFTVLFEGPLEDDSSTLNRDLHRVMKFAKAGVVRSSSRNIISASLAVLCFGAGRKGGFYLLSRLLFTGALIGGSGRGPFGDIGLNLRTLLLPRIFPVEDSESVFDLGASRRGLHRVREFLEAYWPWRKALTRSGYEKFAEDVDVSADRILRQHSQMTGDLWGDIWSDASDLHSLCAIFTSLAKLEPPLLWIEALKSRMPPSSSALKAVREQFADDRGRAELLQQPEVAASILLIDAWFSEVAPYGEIARYVRHLTTDIRSTTPLVQAARALRDFPDDDRAERDLKRLFANPEGDLAGLLADLKN
ncbi:MAG TPA: NACHT domain-containing protein [Thermoanaerobaculia bacterium]|nr:NACHT domain-containing protein [Thermoanaerobaculia bacterium]